MKKVILISMLAFPSMLWAQVSIPGLNMKSAMFPVSLEQIQPVADLGFSSTLSPAYETKNSLAKYRSQVYDFVKIGYSWYDLQTNASVGRRAILHTDGTITMAWTFSNATSTSWPDRGTGINYYNGTGWGAFPTARTESSRTGWPSIGIFPDGKVYTIAHDFEGGGMVMTTNSGKGKTDWGNQSKILTYNGGEPIWNRTANNGDTMHVLSNFYVPAGGTNVVINKITNPTTYSRSLDGGKTWKDLHILLPGYDSTRYASGGSDAYAIDVKGSVVAIAIGGSTKDLSIWKSMDNGDNWTKIIADSFRFPAFVWGSKLIDQNDPAISNDGSMDILIDNNNNVHVAFGLLAFYDDDISDNLMFAPQFYNLYHWSENNPTRKICGTPINMDGDQDANGNPIYTITGETTASLGSDGNPQGSLSYGARYGSTSISSHPSLSVSANNTIFVTYDAPVEFTFHDYNANFRDVHISYSTDGGATWAAPQNATQIRHKEAVYACMTKRTNDFVHFLFQEDIHPGTNLINNGNSGLHPNVENTINYAAIPVKDILDGKLGQNNLSDRPLERDDKVFLVSQQYPNPFSGLSTAIIYLRSAANVWYTISDASGKVVKHESLGFIHAGNHEIQIDGSSLQSGLYFLNLNTPGYRTSHTLNVMR